MTNALRMVRESPVFVTGLVLGVVLATADIVSGAALWHAAIAFCIVVGWAVLVTVLGPRSETFSALAGRPVDERWEHINVQASAAALGVSAIAALFAFAVAEVTHGDPLPYALIATVMGVSYLGALAWFRLRA